VLVHTERLSKDEQPYREEEKKKKKKKASKSESVIFFAQESIRVFRGVRVRRRRRRRRSIELREARCAVL